MTPPVAGRTEPAATTPDPWPPLPVSGWRDTLATLHMWTQVVGKVRLARAPLVNHWWNIPLYVSPRGLTTSTIPYGTRAFAIEFDFLSDRLRVETSDGGTRETALEPRTVADFHADVMDALDSLGVPVEIWSTPVEVEDRTPFEEDTHHAAYDPEAVRRFWRALASTDRVLGRFRSRFLGKCSPVHFFWGSFDMAVTRFSGRTAPPHPGVPNVADFVSREAYSHECSSAGFWPGGGDVEALFYAYAYPEPDGFRDRPVAPEAAGWSDELREFVLPYEAVRTDPDPEGTLLRFLQDSYEAAADAGGWDRAALERRGEGPGGGSS